VRRPGRQSLPDRRRQDRGPYHTARFILVPALREELNVAVPPDRAPGRSWSPGPAVDADTAEVSAGRPIRIGYARCSTERQELASQLAALQEAGCTRVFSEKISTRVKVRPELEQALRLCRDIKDAAPGQAVILTVHEMKRLARNAAELHPASLRERCALRVAPVRAGGSPSHDPPEGPGPSLRDDPPRWNSH
jgi:hypothetical protein